MAFWACQTSPAVPAENAHATSSAIRRIANAAIAAGHIASGPLLGELAIALGASALAASLIPPDYLPDQMMPSRTLAPLWMLVAAFPVYINPATGMMQIIVLTRAQLSFGAAGVLLLWGIGQNAAFARRMAGIVGGRGMLIWLAIMLLTCIAAGYAVDAAWVIPGESDNDIHYERTDQTDL